VTSRQPKELALGTVGLGGNEVSLYSKKDERNVRRVLFSHVLFIVMHKTLLQAATNSLTSPLKQLALYSEDHGLKHAAHPPSSHT